MACTVAFVVNGVSREVAVESRMSLADCLRDALGLTGTHLGCEHGVCGACTVLVDGVPVRSCLTLAAACSGRTVTTVEGLKGRAADELREAFAEHHGLQCGFCTPGMLITCTDLLAQPENLDEAGVRLGLAGNVCRCTGYSGIVKAVLAAQESLSGSVAESGTGADQAPDPVEGGSDEAK